MKKYLLISSLLLSSVMAQSIEFKHYCNTKFAFCIDYPSTLTKQAFKNPDGREFKSSDGSVRMLVYGSFNSLQEKLETRYKAESTSSASREVSFKTFAPDGFTIVSLENNLVSFEKILYQNDTYKTLLISYPTAQAQIYQAITTKIADSFQHSQ